MITPKYILAIDQGTSSTKALVIDADARIIGASSPGRYAVKAKYPRPGWVEFDPARMLETVCDSAREAVQDAGLRLSDIAGIGLANQGETVIAFDTQDGRPVYSAISWQDRRAEQIVWEWRQSGLEADVLATTGLRLDAYFSAAKLVWMLRNVPEARSLHSDGRLRYGTSDAWLIWQLTGGHHFVTDVSTSSRAMLLDLNTLQWSPGLAESLGIPLAGLPQVVRNSEIIGETTQELFGAAIPISGICVDQQAALFGHRAYEVGDTKITYGTGCFVLSNIGGVGTRRTAGLLTSVGWQLADEATYVFDGGVYNAGSIVDWLCGLGLATDVNEVSMLAGEVGHSRGAMLIPAFSGLAAPRWSGSSRACWVGMDQGTDRRHLLRASLEAIAFRVKEILDAMAEAGLQPRHIDIDGGLAQCDLLMQIQADVLGVPLTRSSVQEFTALGVGYLAGLGCGVWSSPQRLAQPEDADALFEPNAAVRDHYDGLFEQWKRACSAVVAMGDAGIFRHSSDGEPA